MPRALRLFGALSTAFVPPRAHASTCDRRSVVLSVAAAGVLPAAPSFAVSGTASTTARIDAVDDVLSRVPAYLVTNSKGEPYLTEADADGKRYGSVFIGPRDAAPLLDAVRKFDTTATLAVVPLSTVYRDVAKTVAGGVLARQSVPQPPESTSTDARLLQLRPLSDEDENLAAISMLPGATMQPGVLLYYEPSLYLGADEASRRRPYFFRLRDLNFVWREGGGDDRNSGRISPSLRVIPLESLLRQVESGEVSVPPLLMPPSETAELTYRAAP